MQIRASATSLAALCALLGACCSSHGENNRADQPKPAQSAARPDQQAAPSGTEFRVLTVDYDRRVQGSLDWSRQRTPAIVYAAFDYGSADDQYKLVQRKATVQLVQVALPNSISVRFTESPMSAADFDRFNPTAIVTCSGKFQRYNVGNNFANDAAFRLVYLSIVPLEAGAGMLVAGYGAGAAAQGFAVLRYSPSKCELRTLPVVSYGKVVVSPKNPDRLIVWSVSGQGWDTANSPTYYATRLCTWGRGTLSCSRPQPQEGMFIPNAINNPGIEVEGYRTRDCISDDQKRLFCTTLDPKVSDQK